MEDMGLVNRGENAEITTLEQAVASEMSGNVIDLCPVGALTSKPYAFVARHGADQDRVDDAMDAVGSNIGSTHAATKSFAFYPGSMKM